MCKQERTVSIKIKAQGNVLEVYCNKRLKDKLTFKKGELDEVRFGILAKNLRFVIEDLQIKGGFDPEKLTKR